MEFRTDILHIDPGFPFAIYHGTGFLSREEGYMHRHHSLEINYCLYGRGKYYIGDREYDFEKGDIFIINDLEYHRAENVSGDMELLVVVFDAFLVLSGGEDYALIRAFYEWKTGFKHKIAVSSPVSESIYPIFQEMDQEWKNQEVGCRLVLKGLLIKLLAVLYRSFERTEGYRESIRKFQTGYVRLSPAMEMITNHFRDPITLEMLSGAVHMNKNYFSTVFSSLFGITVSEYIVLRRLKYAADQLLSTDGSIISISLDAGFRNVSYFSRAFKKQFGMTPGQYRELIHK